MVKKDTLKSCICIHVFFVCLSDNLFITDVYIKCYIFTCYIHKNHNQQKYRLKDPKN